MNETTCRWTDCSVINEPVFTLSMHSLKLNLFSDILMAVWVQWYAEKEGSYFLGLTSIFKGFDTFSKTGEVHCLVLYSRL